MLKMFTATSGNTFATGGQKKMNKLLLTPLILCLALFGGVQFYTKPVVLAGFVVAYAGLLAGVLIIRPAPSPLPAVFRWPVLAVLVSVLVNDLSWWTANRLWLYSAGLLVIMIKIDAENLRQAIFWAGAIWLLTWPLVIGNRNIQAVWPVLFIISALPLSSPLKWPYVGLLLAEMVFFLGSRGAIVGLAAALAVYYAELRRLRAAWLPGLVIATGIVAILAIWRLPTALNRFYYWQRALEVFWHNPLVGVGPGGIRALGLIIEPGGTTLQVHAHNPLITTMAETGLAGLASVIVSARQFCALKFNFDRWQAAMLAALAVHSLVDEPLWWPGPLMMVSLILGSVRLNYGRTDSGHSTQSTGRPQGFVAGATGGN
jgi:hypothetical protein